MSPWDIFDALVNVTDWVTSWRWSVCIVIGVILGVAAMAKFPEPWSYIVCGVCVLGGIVIGWWWDRRA